MSKEIYIDGLHRPYNMPIKEVVWVCQFLKNESKRYDKKYLYVAFWKYFINYMIVNSERISDNKRKNGIISFSKASNVKDWMKKYKTIESLSQAVTTILRKRNDDTEREVYSSYKNTSYYVSLTRKLGFVNEKWTLSDDALRLVRINRSFYELTESQIKILFRSILKVDRDFFIPLLLSIKYEKKMPLIKDGDVVLKYLQEEENVKFFKYIRKSILPNYYKVRRYWVDDLRILDRRFTIRLWAKAIIIDLFGAQYFETISSCFIKFVTKYVVSENDSSKKYKKIESQYNWLVRNGKNDQGYVNLYEMKSVFRISFENFEKLIRKYMIDVSGKKIVLLSNTVMSIDSRRRFIINGTPAIKIKIIDKKG